MISDKQEALWVAGLLVTNNYRLLRRVDLSKWVFPEPEGDIKSAVFVDVETTGLHHGQDKVIELGMQAFDFDARDRIVGLGPSYQGFQDPGMPIPQKITEITGITDEDVRGRSLNELEINDIFGHARLIIAHNARFDRPFVEFLAPQTAEMAWACSIQDLDWEAMGMRTKSLDYLLMRHGLFHEAHRALDDVQAGVALLGEDDPDGKQLFLRLTKQARRPSFVLTFHDTPFDWKDSLKAMGCFWSPGDDGQIKGWSMKCASAEEAKACHQHVVDQLGPVEAILSRYNALTRYKHEDLPNARETLKPN
ncbi:MAG TPA: DNA polymerase III subunit epsilon [Alphaproteobacteria bacterium]|nr:DNA polymerase III subunit epsilon [Paracoccaceae bacterium]RCL78011.1 MAG: hypothetical protein DBW67_07845 [SAR116 cluster bacterium]RPH14262.1 MAG: hypothetical protein CBD10_000065 [Alphaproteobacteria bacterium TMED150]HCJ61433.1 DNA polymerase III subunit epsilon [Alphaproteobacteria bacterium]HCY48381.1 DNA polymerase III subunit epsilon [Alphaproteobacteria bacterium]|tara:strand:- start:339 stop:1259 length:921 start_codon:yes stop_codon:yes gene_type:complete